MGGNDMKTIKAQKAETKAIGQTTFLTDQRDKRHKFGVSKGQSLTEFAMVLPLLLLLIFGVVDFGRLFFVEMTLQNAVRQAGRFAVTGNHLPDSTKPGVNMSRVNSIKQVAQDAAIGLDVTSIQISSKTGGSGNAGGPGDTVTISITSNLKLITPIIGQFFGSNSTYTFTVSVSFRNEPFPPANTN